MFNSKKRFMAGCLMLLTLISLPLFPAEKKSQFYALCLTESPFKNYYFVQVFIIDAGKNAVYLDPSVQIRLDKHTQEPILDRSQYKVAVRRFLLQADRPYQITSTESNVPDTPSFFFQGELKKLPDSSFSLIYKYEESDAGKCLKLEGTTQLGPGKIWLQGGVLREEKQADIKAEN